MDKTKLTDADIHRQIPAARRRASRVLRAQPRAAGVRYERRTRSLHIALSNGAALMIPVDLIAPLAHHSDADLGDVAIGAVGHGLHWARLDADLTLVGLVELALGAHLLLRASGAAGGAARSKAKTRAARLNGLQGGRPRKRSAKATRDRH